MDEAPFVWTTAGSSADAGEHTTTETQTPSRDKIMNKPITIPAWVLGALALASMIVTPAVTWGVLITRTGHLETELNKITGRLDVIREAQAAQAGSVAAMQVRIDALPSPESLGKLAARVEATMLGLVEAEATLREFQRETDQRLSSVESRIPR